MENNPWALVLMIGIGSYVINLWITDYRANRAQKATPQALPGAFPSTLTATLIAALGAALLLSAETWGEYKLGISDAQTNMVSLFAAYTLIAAFIEEIIFRGYLVVTKKGPVILWIGIVGCSAIFALIHPHLWKWENGYIWNGGHLVLTLTLKGWFSTAAIFLGSLWFYAVRFLPFNKTQSLIPCFAAHFAKNLGVIVIKASQGFLSFN